MILWTIILVVWTLALIAGTVLLAHLIHGVQVGKRQVEQQRENRDYDLGPS